MVLEVEMVQEIARIGRLRAPSEACGILLPYPVRGRYIWEMPNRSDTPHDSFIMNGEDIVMTLEQTFYPNPVPDDIVEQLIAWHTHPQGNVGPSAFDLQSKPPKLKCLVVSLGQNGEPNLPTRY